MTSIKGVYSFPNIHRCREIFQSIALLDAIIMPEWEYRYYSFNSKWDKGEMMASMRDGSGQHYFAIFNEYGVIIKGFDYYSPSGMTIRETGLIDKDIFRNIPSEFGEFINEPAFIIDQSTFCLWNLKSKEQWCSSKKYVDDELHLLNILNVGPEGYIKWAEEYYEVEIPIDAVSSIFDFKLIDLDTIRLINAETNPEDIIVDIEEIGYPFK